MMHVYRLNPASNSILQSVLDKLHCSFLGGNRILPGDVENQSELIINFIDFIARFKRIISIFSGLLSDID